VLSCPSWASERSKFALLGVEASLIASSSGEIHSIAIGVWISGNIYNAASFRHWTGTGFGFQRIFKIYAYFFIEHSFFWI
jgi:hypothetical protein